MQHSRIIDELTERLGSQVKLASRLGLANSTICHWRNDDGIPPRHWPKLLMIAKYCGVRLTLGQLVAGPARPEKKSKAA